MNNNKMMWSGNFKKEFSDSLGGGKLKLRIHNHIISYGKITISVQQGSKILKTQIDNRGYNNSLSVENASIIHSHIFIYGSNNVVEIGEGTCIRDAVIHLGDDNNRLHIGNDCDAGKNLKIYILEGTNVSIGDHCMFSTDVTLRTSDAHPIFDTNGKRINKAKDIRIGEHVWFGEKVTCLKGVEIGNNVVSGGLTLFTNGRYMENTVYAGIPARRIREHIFWMKER